MKKLLIVLIFLFLSFQNIYAEDSSYKELTKAKSIRCFFDQGVLADWDEGRLNIQVEIFSDDKDSSFITFDNIDLINKTAWLTTSSGSTDVTISLTDSGLTFFEYTSMGNLVITTIFPSKLKNSGDFKMVQSSHRSLLSQPVVQQRYGTAKILERY